MKKAKLYGVFFLIGGVVYWGSDILFHWLKPAHFVWISLLTFGVPVIVGLTWYYLFKRHPFDLYPFGFPIFMLLGIWALGPLGIAIGMHPMGGKFFEPDQVMGFLQLWVAFPLATFTMATYSGSLGGVIITTFLLIIVALISKKRIAKRNAILV